MAVFTHLTRTIQDWNLFCGSPIVVNELDYKTLHFTFQTITVPHNAPMQKANSIRVKIHVIGMTVEAMSNTITVPRKPSVAVIHKRLEVVYLRR